MERKNCVNSPFGQGEIGHRQTGGDQAEVRAPASQPRQALGRRDLLKAITAVPAAALVPLAPAVGRAAKDAGPRSAPPWQAARTAAAYQPKVLEAHEWKTIQVLSDLIIPADDRSGSATHAGVPAFIDDWLDFKRGVTLDAIRGGLTWLDMECNRQFGRDFIDCPESEQKQILDRIAYPKTAASEDAAGVAFFSQVRDLVVSGFFSSEMGVKDLPYLGNQMLSEWNGCPAGVLTKLDLKRG